ncbi:MAG TPA: (Fe-S)-binding protein [Puia sp.]|nr:(Fe-S)-binding protein [Puia sp.]
MIVQLFVPCFVDQLFPDTAFNMIRVLEKAGCAVHYNPNQTCCGQPAFNAGFWQDAKEVCSKFIDDFSGNEIVVTPSASCAGFVRNYYQKIFENSSLHNVSRDMQKRVFEFSEFLIKVMRVEDFGAEFHAKVTYHDSCAALRDCGIKDEPRQLLSCVRGLELIEMDDNETCCGFGGTFAVKFTSISGGMAEQKLEHAIQTGAQYLISSDLSCLMHLDGFLRKRHMPLQTMHIADVISKFV